MMTDTHMNGGAAPMADPNLVKFVEELLMQVKAGQITTVGAVAIAFNNSIQAQFYGPATGLLCNGVDILKWRLMCGMMNIGYGADGPKKQAPGGHIIRAAGPVPRA
jgi:hypothetical protein